ncbi:MAG TPA: CaiB/BaiF CoA-transferase family protein [Acidimicrobiales bacterium]|nr:CaiB/BaiF CoA-transferase family protein [Acidimicrobiales bacterium]
MPPPGAGPLEGTSVLDLSSVGPASRATRLLADYGARVVKIAPPPGRAAALPVPPFYAYGARRGMQRALIGLDDPEGLEAFMALASRSDVVVESFRPGTADRLGIGYEAVRALNPGVVYCSTSGYGRRGPRSGWAGHDLDYLAVGGYLAMTEPAAGGSPPLPGATIADAAAGGMQAALAITAALLRRAATGEGTLLDVSVAGGVLWLMSLAVDEHLATGTSPAPGHDVLSGRYACYGTYRAADDRWLAVAAIEPKFFANLCRALDCEGWLDRQYDDEAQGELRKALSDAFARRDRDTWVSRLAGADTCVAPVQSVDELATDEQFAFSGSFVEAKSDRHGSFRQVGAVLAGMERPAEPVEVPDEESTDTEDLLAAVGYERSRLAELKARGVLA